MSISRRSSFGGSYHNAVKPAILVDIGRGYTKAGFSGNVIPRVCVKSEVILKDMTCSGVLKIEKVCKESPEIQRILFYRFLKEIFLTHLKVTVRNEKVFIILSPFTNDATRCIISDILLDKFKVKTVFFLFDSLCSLIPYNIESAIVVNLGYTDATVTPIYAKVPMVFVSILINVGALEICEFLRTQLGVYYGVEDIHLDDTKLLNLLFKYGDALHSDSSNETMKVSFDDVLDYKALPFKPCYEAISLYFDKNNELNLVQIINNCIKDSPLDTRMELTSNIIFTGGFSDIRNIRKRFLQELGDANFQMKIHKETLPGAYLPWTGASLLVNSILEHGKETMISDDVVLGSFVSSVWPNFST